MKTLILKMKSKRAQSLMKYGVMAVYVAFAIRLGTVLSTLVSAFSAPSLVH
jgi:hypothetical protein